MTRTQVLLAAVLLVVALVLADRVLRRCVMGLLPPDDVDA